jgi:hypothetical protein
VRAAREETRGRWWAWWVDVVIEPWPTELINEKPIGRNPEARETGHDLSESRFLGG